ncbi:PGF-CTERM sorting domain-containing protein [Haloarchaeobius sp. DYHT-AS-18]|uniref:PGF-CTERM sorting domain-containing protein n=1 Tax=Haloarchaeobius sp. DYHT-AS-18 TaxID=3446117 RepID=UPI003EBDBF42
MYVPRILLAVALLVLATPVAVAGSAEPVPAVGHDSPVSTAVDSENSSLTTATTATTDTVSNLTVLTSALPLDSLDSYAELQAARDNRTLVPGQTVGETDTVVLRFEAPGLRSRLADYDGPNLTTRFHRFVTGTNATFSANHSNPVQRLYRGEAVPLGTPPNYDGIVLTDPAASTLVPGPANETYYQVVDLGTVEVVEGRHEYSPGIDCGHKWAVTSSLDGNESRSASTGFETECPAVWAETTTVTVNRTTARLTMEMAGFVPGERLRVRLLGTGTNETGPTIWPATGVPWHEAIAAQASDEGRYIDKYQLPVDIAHIEPNTTVVAKVQVVQRNGTRVPVHEERFVVPTETTTAPSTTTTAPTTTQTVPISTTPDAEKTTATPPATSAAPANNTHTSPRTPQTDEVPGFTVLGTLLALTCAALLGRRR